MAEDSDEERTEEPTPKRLADARKQGQIPRSREFNTLAVLLAGIIGIFVYGTSLMNDLWNVMDHDLRLTRRDLFDPQAPLAHLGHDLGMILKMLAPLLGLTVVAALAAPIGLGGWNFASESLLPKLDKLNPLKGLGRMVSMQALVEAVKAVLKLVLVAGVTTGLFIHYLDDFMGLSRLALLPAVAKALHLITICLFWLVAAVGLVAALDVPYQLWTWKRQLRMTRQEIRDEMRDAEGKPEVKSRIRSLQMEFARRRMMDEVPKADVVITNPTHYAVALKYDQNAMNAPKVVAKGADLIAAQIRNLAQRAEVPLLSAPPLARALYASTELDHEIPPGLYLAVAQVLAYIYQLKAARFGGDIPAPLGDIPVPKEFLKD